MARSSKDIAKRLRFDHRPRPDAFRRWYLATGLAACLLGAGAWFGLGRTTGERQYLPGPLTPAHATFGERCAHCHVSFASVPDAKCLDCHAQRPHSEFEVRTPPCRDCHVEHRAPQLLLPLSGQACVDCHGDLTSTRNPAVAAHVPSFAAHPQFTPLRDGAQDHAALRFNHRLHLSSKDVNEVLTCASCHVVDRDGRYMQPIVFEQHCQRCHELKVTQDVPAPISSIAAPHEDPGTIRDALTGDLLSLGAQRGTEIFTVDNTVLLPGRVARGPIDESRSLQEFEKKYLALFEKALYAPFADKAPLLDNNKHCFLCHVQGAEPGPGGLPVVVETKIPARWLMRDGFSHRRHDKLPCETCHAAAKDSSLTSDVNLPGKAVCERCHATDASRSAGTECMSCHRYHHVGDALHDQPPPVLTIERLLGGDE